MATIKEYLRYYKGLSFKECCFNINDVLLFTELSYIDWHNIVSESNDKISLRDAFDKYQKTKDVYLSTFMKGNIQNVKDIYTSTRYKDIYLSNYREYVDDEKQFGAITIHFDDKIFVSYKGTNGTVVGWKEDFTLGYEFPIISQVYAIDYLNEVAKEFDNKIFVGGHSKGGNLAVYALANSDDFIKRRIVKAYSHDGPGFLEEVLKSDSFQSISNKIDKTVPKSSMIGMFLQQHENYRVVSSNSFSVWQHNPFSWTIKDNEFEYIDDLTNDAKYFNHTLNEWVASLTNEERERLVDILFSLIDDDVDKTDEIFKNWQTTIPNALKVISNTDEQTKNFVKDIVKEFFSLCVKNFPELFKK